MKALFFLGLFFSFLLPAIDPDLGWQLKCGELILKKQGFCSQNQFSSLLADYHWTNHHWLYQTFLFSVWEKFGLWGLSIFNALVVTAIFIIFYLAINNYRLEKKLAAIFILIFTWGVFSFGIRSQLLGIFYFTLVLFTLLKNNVPRYFLPLIFLLWANTHGSVVLGLAFLFLFSIKDFKKNYLIFFFSFLAVFVNPFGAKIFQEAWHHFTTAHLEKLIAEWVPPHPFKQIIMLIGGILLILATNKKLLPTIAAFTFFALKARRNPPFFLILFFVLLFKNPFLKKWLSPWLKKKSLRKDLLIFTSILTFFFGLFFRLPQTIKINSSWQNYCQASSLSYPREAITFLKNQSEKDLPAGQAGNLFNRYEWGGFLIWQLPEYKVFVDGRMPAWPTPSGKSPYTIYLETLQTQPGWQETLDNYHINWILISPGTFMDLKLKPNPEEFGWSEAYRDKISVVYKRKNN